MRFRDGMKRVLAAGMLAGAVVLSGAVAGAAKAKPPTGKGPITGEVIGAHGARVDLVLVIDTTGSMWDELATAKDQAMAAIEAYTRADPPAAVRVGVVAYRDKGEDATASYRIQSWPIDADLGAARKFIWDLTAKGGGDRPEDVAFALKVAINEMPWDMDKNTARSIVLIGDAPLKVYPDEPSVKVLGEAAKKKNITINAVSVGAAKDTMESFRAIAEVGGGAFEIVKPEAPRPGDMPKPDPGGRRDVVFVIDTTGSMGGYIETARVKMRALAKSMASGASDSDMQESLSVRFGLIDYRDKGDEWRVKRYDFTSDIGEFLGDLDLLVAGGGGDWPESGNLALQKAVTDFEWDPSAGKSIILIGDAPPHEDYGEKDHVTVAKMAKAKGIVVNTVACSGGDEVPPWKEIAKITGGDFYMLDGLGAAIDHTIGD